MINDKFMISSKIYKGVAGGLFALCLLACTPEDNSYEPGKPVSATSVGAYFPNTNKSEIIKADSDEKSFEVTVKREKTDNAVSIPIEVVSKTDNISIPSTVEFAAGEEETSITLTYTDLETTPKFDIRLKEEYTNPYKIKDGSMEFAGNVFRLNLISDNVIMKDYDASSGYTTIFKDIVTSIYQMGNENKFIWRNFLGSGIDLKFKIDGSFNSEDVFKSSGSVVPLNHYIEYGEDGWCLASDEEGTLYADWSVPNGTVEGWIFFYYEYEGSSYFYIDLNPTTSKSGKEYGWGYFWPAYYDSWSNLDYSAFYIYYN